MVSMAAVVDGLLPDVISEERERLAQRRRQEGAKDSLWFPTSHLDCGLPH